MKQRVFRGKRIRPSDKDLVFHFTVASLLPILLLVVGLFHVKTIQQVNWQDFNLSQAEQYLVTTEFDDDTVQAIMDEALKYEGWRYVYGGASPTTSFDCSGLTQWTYGKAGINLPRTAQQQYDVTQHIPLSEAQAGDLVFFHSTYNAGSYITHVGIYLGNNRMFHAGDPIGYADLTSPYWQQHLVGAGRIKQ